MTSAKRGAADQKAVTTSATESETYGAMRRRGRSVGRAMAVAMRRFRGRPASGGSQRLGLDPGSVVNFVAMTLFMNSPDLIARAPVAVMQATCADDLAEIQRLWPWFEERVGLQGRKMYAAADVLAQTYSTCTPLREGDNPAHLGLEVGELPGGMFRRGRLRGTPPEIYASIGPGLEELESGGAVDQSRPLIEFYRRHDEIELWVPVTS